MKTGLFYDPIFTKHDTDGHPENAGRLDALVAGLDSSGLMSRVEGRTARLAEAREITLVHDLDYMQRMEAAAQAGHPFLDTPDCVMSPETYTVALHAAGALVDAVVDVAEGRLDNAFVACRPPGHHAERGGAMGFCFFNNIAIAAATLTEHMGYKRVLIFDFDVHHGNGTQHTFEERSDVLFASIHQHPRTLFPGTGFSEERGSGAGLGYTLNAPMPPYSTDEHYQQVFDQVFLPRFEEFRPDFVLLSAGFDAHRDDPLAQIDLTQAGFDTLLTGMKELALRHSGAKIVSVLEGGYNYQRLAECVASHIALLQGDPA